MREVPGAEPRGTREILISLKDLPAMPETHTQILRMVNDPSATPAELETIIIRDPALTSRVIGTANSPFYGLSRQLGTIREAVFMLGLQKIRDLAASMTVSNLFKSIPNDLVDGRMLWKHCMATAIWGQAIARQVQCHNVGPLFTASLLHDIGILLMLEVISERYTAVLRQARESKTSHYSNEEQLLGTTHSRIGAAACTKWLLPPAITQLICYHHARECPVETQAQILLLADYLAGKTGNPEFVWCEPDPLPEDLLSELQIKDRDLDLLMQCQQDINLQVEAFTS